MESKNIILILLIIIVVLAAAIGVMMLSPAQAKEDTIITIESNDTLYEGDNLTVKLTDINGSVISGESVKVTIDDKDGGLYQTTVFTNASGIGVVELDKTAGNYTVNCTYDGNENYTGNTTSQSLTILKEVVEPVVVQQSSSQESSYPSGLTDDEIDAYIQRDLDERAKNGVEGAYDYEGAKEFYRNVPPEGMV